VGSWPIDHDRSCRPRAAKRLVERAEVLSTMPCWSVVMLIANASVGLGCRVHSEDRDAGILRRADDRPDRCYVGVAVEDDILRPDRSRSRRGFIFWKSKSPWIIVEVPAELSACASTRLDPPGPMGVWLPDVNAMT
jgi:hypothetical protein